MGYDGFDAVETVMDIEDTFGISIPDKDAERLRTAGDLSEYVATRVRARTGGASERCTGAAAFFRMRSRVASYFELDPQDLRPKRALDSFLPTERVRRKDAWHRLATALGVRLPPLERPQWAQRVVVALFLIAIFPGGLALAPLLRYAGFADSAIGVGIVLTGIIMPLLLVAATTPWAVHVHPDLKTLGHASSLLVGEELHAARQKRSGWTRHEVWELVRLTIAQSADLPPAAISKRTKFSEL